MKKDILKLIATGKLSEALDLLEPYSDNIILLKAQLVGATNDNLAGLTDRTDYNRTVARLNYAVQNIVDSLDLPEKSTISATTTTTVSQMTDKSLAAQTASNTPKKPKIFISYAHEDMSFLSDLMVQLKPLERKERIEIWTDDKILPGQEWSKVILDNLSSADIVIMLLSPDFLASNYISRNEVRLGLEKRTNGAVVLPIVIRDCLWKLDLPDLAALQALPQDENGRLKPIKKWGDDTDTAWLKVAEGIVKVVNSMS